VVAAVELMQVKVLLLLEAQVAVAVAEVLAAVVQEL
jgi:hypothetical protein